MIALRRALASVGASGTVLDLPCGAGRFSELIAGFAGTYIAADASLPMLRICLSRAASMGRPPAFLTDARAFALEDRSVDGIVVMRLVHHIPAAAERRAVIHDCARVAEKFLIVSFLDRRTPKQKLHAWKRSRRGLGVRRAAVDRSEIEADLVSCGFRAAGFFGISSLFSGQVVAAAVRSGSP